MSKSLILLGSMLFSGSLMASVGTISSELRCTAFAVSNNEVMTAKHCWSPDVGGVFTYDEYEHRIVGVTEDYPESDVVRLEVDGYIWEYLELETEVLTVDNQISMIDRHGNVQQSEKYGFLNVDVDGEVTVQDGVFAHGIPAVPGNSGSPILKDGKVVGVHLGKVGQGMFYAADVSTLGYVEHKFAADKQAIQVIPFILKAGRACYSAPQCWGAVAGAAGYIAGLTNTMIDNYQQTQRELILQQMKNEEGQKNRDHELLKLEKQHGYDLQKEILKAQLAQKNGKGKDKADIKLDKPIPGQNGHTIFIVPRGGGSAGNEPIGPINGGPGTIVYECGSQRSIWNGKNPTVYYDRDWCVVIHGESEYSLSNDEFLASLMGGSIMKIWGDNWRVHGIPVVPGQQEWPKIEAYLRKAGLYKYNLKRLRAKILEHQGQVVQEYYRPTPPGSGGGIVSPPPNPDPGKVAIP
ncbi:trypsin-like peptidase domain-containing protein [Pseudobacteriovorax antillogorgiicola]|uniref:Trypsin-like peptidase domain-containing protein n=1 Tax=Pseudobacteriovorax antillogorgiicola TaxID=1513793 RepID=A0A1Y6CPM0_9BACT|nr:trypsin-like peptidase domain-containing protein [Pseudobacteriovorax antillogorgiicola]TCS44242.1 hypothetical protein EDD56_13442 [Pseudobacteriovorax antillogorgiicola]SMF80694.1 hypothetical protein SAMN06296036_13543 [Pseudobacteriovorax antillogorgiicola]